MFHRVAYKRRKESFFNSGSFHRKYPFDLMYVLTLVTFLTMRFLFYRVHDDTKVAALLAELVGCMKLMKTFEARPKRYSSEDITPSHYLTLN